MNIPESQGPRDTAPPIIPPGGRDPAPKRKFGAMKGQLDLPDEFFDPLPPDELALWEQDIGTCDPPYRIDIEGGEMVIRIRRDAVDPDFLPRFLDYLTVAWTRSKSAMTDEEIADLAADVDRAGAARLRSRLEDRSS